MSQNTNEEEFFFKVTVTGDTFNYSTNMLPQDVIFWMEAAKSKLLNKFVPDEEPQN